MHEFSGKGIVARNVHNGAVIAASVAPLRSLRETLLWMKYNSLMEFQQQAYNCSH